MLNESEHLNPASASEATGDVFYSDKLADEGVETEANSVSYEAYRELDRAAGSYRYTGILSPESYEKATRDPSTVYVTTKVGPVPGVVSAEHMEGFDIQRAKKLTGKENIALLTVPASVIPSDVQIEMDLSSTAVITESSSVNEQEDTLRLSSLFASPGEEVELQEFIDPRIEQDGYNTAWLAYYSSLAVPIESQESPHRDIKRAFLETQAESLPHDGLTLLSGADVIDNQAIRDQLWDLFKDRFEWLGDYHPVSMEDTREVFESVVSDPSTFTSAKFEDGKLTCAGIFMHDATQCPWLREEFLDDLAQNDDPSTIQMYFFGIASTKSSEAVHRMEEVVKFHSSLAAKAGVTYRIMFESSNMSSLYIPRVVDQYIDDSGTMRMQEKVKQIDKLHYRYLTQAR